MNSNLSHEVKRKLQDTFVKLDPITLLEQMECCQLELWAMATHANAAKVAADSLAAVFANAAGSSGVEEVLIQVRQHRAGLKARSRLKLSDSVAAKASRDGQASRMRDYIFRLPAGQMFRTEDLLAFGSRASANQQLKLLLRRGKIVRRKPGCYATPGPEQAPDSITFQTTGCQAEDMRRYIFGLSSGQMFRIEELLRFGSRASANQLLKGLLRREVLMKLRPGRYATLAVPNDPDR